MGWSASLTESSPVGTSVTFTPDATQGSGTDTVYSVSAFTAKKKGIYKFELHGSGGVVRSEPNTDGGAAAGGAGGKTIGYLLLEAGETVYVGAGTPCAAAFVAASNGTSLEALLTSGAVVYLIAGGGGGGGAVWGTTSTAGISAGGKGGGESGGAAYNPYNSTEVFVTGGTQTAGGAGGYAQKTGTKGRGYVAPYKNENNISTRGGQGGDGYWGGGTGNSGGYGVAYGGGGGSGYVKTASLTVGSKTYSSTTSQGGGSASNTAGKVVVTFYANAVLPVWFKNKGMTAEVQLTKIYFNGKEVSLTKFGDTTLANNN